MPPCFAATTRPRPASEHFSPLYARALLDNCYVAFWPSRFLQIEPLAQPGGICSISIPCRCRVCMVSDNRFCLASLFCQGVDAVFQPVSYTNRRTAAPSPQTPGRNIRVRSKSVTTRHRSANSPAKGRRADRRSDFLPYAHDTDHRSLCRLHPGRRQSGHGDARHGNHAAGDAGDDDPAGQGGDARLLACSGGGGYALRLL